MCVCVCQGYALHVSEALAAKGPRKEDHARSLADCSDQGVGGRPLTGTLTLCIQLEAH